jgi:hypothetical protein
MVCSCFPLKLVFPCGSGYKALLVLHWDHEPLPQCRMQFLRHHWRLRVGCLHLSEHCRFTDVATLQIRWYPLSSRWPVKKRHSNIADRKSISWPVKNMSRHMKAMSVTIKARLALRDTGDITIYAVAQIIPWIRTPYCSN